MKLELPTTRVIYKLPEILSQTEVERLLNASGNIKHKTLLMIIYSAGLRVSEAVKLRIKDIDSERMTCHLRGCKNHRDRYVPLSPCVYEQLKVYWRHCRFDDYLFPGQKTSQPISTATAGHLYQQAKQRAGIKKAGGIHALRHAFATHMLEAGCDLFVIKQLLGHQSIHSTVRYLRFIPDKATPIASPIDQMRF